MLSQLDPTKQQISIDKEAKRFHFIKYNVIKGYNSFSKIT